MPKQPEVTICNDCDHVFDRKSAPWHWLCIQHKRLEGFGFVTRETWDNAPPYLRCNEVNGGACPLFKPRKPQEK